MSKRKNAGKWISIIAASVIAVTMTGCGSFLQRRSAEESSASETAGTAVESAAESADEGSTVSQELAARLALEGEGVSSDTASTQTGAAGSTEYAAAAEPGIEEAADGDTEEEYAGKTINIYCWDDTLENLFLGYYPGYTDNGDGTGTLEGYRIRWVMSEDEDGYMDLVAEKLLTDSRLEQDERVDLYLAPEETLAIYVNSEYSADLREEIGLTQEDLADQYEFTKQAGTNEAGTLKAVSWLASPGVFVYRRSIATDVLGSDDPATVQAAIADWDSFTATAAAAKEKGYTMLSGYDDAFAVFRCAAVGQWVQDGQLQIGSAMTQWTQLARNFTQNGYSGRTNVGDAQWVANQGPAGMVFGFFRACGDIDTKLLDYSILNSDGSIAEDGGVYGDYAVCAGPQTFKRGGTWILAAPGTDNVAMDLEILRTLTCDANLLTQISVGENLFTNTMSGMQRMAQEDHADSFLGGQNPYAVYNEAAQSISLSPEGNYDWTLAGLYRSNMRSYLKGEEDLGEAQSDFEEAALAKYPELEIAGEDAEEVSAEAATDGGATDAEIATGE